jgi:AcrR family transcriptional regulator
MSDHAPRQDRSRRTLEAILEATEKLLEKRPFEEISIAEIVLKSGSSTGSFYARFPTKEALLPALYDRYHTGLPERVARLRSVLERRNQTLRRACRLIVDEFAASFEGRENLMRAMVLYARARPEGLREHLGERTSIHEELVSALHPFHDDIRHRDKAHAIRTGLFIAGTAVREAVLFPNAPFAAAVRQPLAKMKTTIAAMLHAYLTSDEENDE